jgi:hypothetical protein
MAAIPTIDDNRLRAICVVIGDTSEGLTGTQIGQLLSQCGIDDPSPGITKRDRLFDALRAKQAQEGCANSVLAFVEKALDPVRFIGNPQGFAAFRNRLNEALAFSGFHLGEDGKLQAVAQARTLNEAQQRAGRLRAELTRRQVHPDVLGCSGEQTAQTDCWRKISITLKTPAHWSMSAMA